MTATSVLVLVGLRFVGESGGRPEPGLTLTFNYCHNLFYAFAYRLNFGVALDLGIKRRFIRIVDAGESLNLAIPGTLVKALDVSTFADGQRSVDIDLNESADSTAGLLAGSSIGRDR